MKRSTYYYHIGNGFNDKYEYVRQQIHAIYERSFGTFGYPTITLELKKKGIELDRKTVYKIMQEEGLSSKVRIKKYSSWKGDIGKTAPNLIKRQFKVDEPFRKLATDITEFTVQGKKLYLSPIIDMYNSEIIAYTLHERATSDLIIDMLNQAIKKIPDDIEEPIILHSDQGAQYRSLDYQAILEKNNIIQSMSRRGNCLDNSIIENFFGILKEELFHFAPDAKESLEQLKRGIRKYIDYYNNIRIKKKLDGYSPIQYRLINTPLKPSIKQ